MSKRDNQISTLESSDLVSRVYLKFYVCTGNPKAFNKLKANFMEKSSLASQLLENVMKTQLTECQMYRKAIF